MKMLVTWALLFTLILPFHGTFGNYENVILFTNRTAIHTVTVDNRNRHIIPLQSLNKVKYLDFDPERNVIYWSDNQNGVISSAGYCGEDKKDIANTTVNAFTSIAVDYVHKRIYWTDSTKNIIESTMLDGQDRKTVTMYDMSAPRDIAVDMVKRRVYWLDSGTKPKIESTNLDGSNRKLVADLADAYPTAMALDAENGKIYWNDNNRKQLLVANTDGSEQRVLLRENMPFVTGLSVLGDYLYWPNFYGNKIERINKTSGLDRTDLNINESDMEDILVIRLNTSVMNCPPSSPSTITIVNSTQTSITLTWDVGYGWGIPQTFYIEQHEKGSEANWTLATKIDNIMNARVLTYELKDLLPSKEYELRLYSCNSNGCQRDEKLVVNIETLKGHSTNRKSSVEQRELFIAIIAVLTVLCLSVIIAVAFACIYCVDRCCGISKKPDEYSAVSYNVTSSTDQPYYS